MVLDKTNELVFVKLYNMHFLRSLQSQFLPIEKYLDLRNTLVMTLGVLRLVVCLNIKLLTITV